MRLAFPLRLLRVLFFSVLLLVALGIQKATELVVHRPASAVAVAFEPFTFRPAAYRLLPGPSIDRKRLPASDSSRPAHPRQWRGFGGPAYHAGAWPRPVKVPRDSAGHVIIHRPGL